MLFLFSDHYKCRLDLRERNLPIKHLSQAPLGLGRLFCFPVKGGTTDGQSMVESGV